ncbi:MULTISPECIES: hypothetical protein [Okeania]|uniref:hypothetical protein n=1 Tax=Okeania TaxID=1458928 RepID=UPI001374BE5E|nr:MULTISPECIES: hypothetical protein [Okeania]NET14678.1 hypothetical protein [Okeania sp. SIO1H6]NES74331.1 hypothetical protein [Okeania sp. SIO1H4]NES87964.1 hypothetical protein [Okeania sp. SIO2B9]NET18352.1 hypothetical protein [Okeania sp. SIO1H5]NET75964.1 hypothetical protein [Okeania sp. SIO1F9]
MKKEEGRRKKEKVDEDSNPNKLVNTAYEVRGIIALRANQKSEVRSRNSEVIPD